MFLLNAVLVVPAMITFNHIEYLHIMDQYFLPYYAASIYIGLKTISAEHKMSYKDTYKQVFKILPIALMVIVECHLIECFHLMYIAVLQLLS